MKSLKKISKVIKESDKFLLCSHINPDGDSTGSELALYGILKKLNKNIEIIDTDAIPRIYKFLPFSENKTTKLVKEQDFDVAIVMDCGNKERLGNLPVDLNKIGTIINIDHHISNINFGNLNYVDPNASSTGELIFHLAKELDIQIDHSIATCLYIAIMTDTGCYKFENTTRGAFKVVSELMQYGIRPEKISKKVYENYSLPGMHLLGLALQTLKLEAGGKVSCMSVTKEMYKITSTRSEDTEGFVNHARAIEGVDVGIFFRETDSGTIKVSMRSKELVDTNKITSLFGGGGHARASGCDVKGSMETIMKNVVAAVKAELKSAEHKRPE